MAPPTDDGKRADALTRLIADHVKSLRKAAGYNQAEFGEAMHKVSPTWSRSTVVKLENYNRESLSAADVLALAYVLKIPPVTLVADPRDRGTVPIAPGVDADPWDALAWLTGTATLDERGQRQEYRRMGQLGADASWLIHQSFLLAEALDVLNAPPLTGTRDENDQLTSDPEVIRRVTDDRHRKALDTVRRVLERIKWDGTANLPDVGEKARRRAVELGVELPGLAG